MTAALAIHNDQYPTHYLAPAAQPPTCLARDANVAGVSLIAGLR
jgi:hypothetical protein